MINADIEKEAIEAAIAVPILVPCNQLGNKSCTPSVVLPTNQS